METLKKTQDRSFYITGNIDGFVTNNKGERVGSNRTRLVGDDPIYEGKKVVVLQILNQQDYFQVIELVYLNDYDPRMFYYK